METEKTGTKFAFLSGHYQYLPDRKLKEDTLKFWQYQVGYYNDKPCHIANYRDEGGKLVCQQLRLPGKEFKMLGDTSDVPLYGAWLWGKGKSIVITEGQLDAMSVSQAFGLRWAVVSLPNGAQSVKKSIKRSYDYLMQFDKIVLMLDQDDPGRKATEEACALLPSGKVYVANLPEKDANEVLVKHGPEAIVRAFWEAKPYRPDGIISGAEISLDELMADEDCGYALRLTDLNEKMYGLRKGEITLVTAGSGIGKSTLVRQLTYEMHKDHGLTFANVYLEEGNKKTAKAYIALDNDVPLGALRRNKKLITPEQWKVSYDKCVADRMWFYNHFGSLESGRLLSKLHYFAKVIGVDFIVLDHVSIVTSGLTSGEGGSGEGERKDIDILMTRLRQLCEETGVGIICVAHLKRVSGKNFNEGGQVSLTDLRGSAALEQLSDNVISMERDQQGNEKDRSLIRVLKCRETGDTGESDSVIYKRDTGKLVLAAVEKKFSANANIEL